MKAMRLYRWCVLALVLPVLYGCGAGEPDQPPAATQAVSEAAPNSTLVTQTSGEGVPMLELWSHSCALCHVDGNAGAPRVGNVDEWAPRLAQGKDVLLQHTLEGINQMPPLGYCMACERSDFVAMIEFMTRGMEATQAEVAQ